MRKIYFLTVLIIVSLLLISCSGELTTMQKSIENNPVKISTPPISSVVQQSVKPQNQQQVIGLGEPLIINDLKFIVNSVTGYKRLGASMLSKDTKGEFYKVCLSLENLGKTSKYLYDTGMIEPQFVLKDGLDRQFDANFEYEMYIADKIDLLEQLQPGLPVDGCKVFELPANAKGLKLLISKGWLTNKAIQVTVKDDQVKHLEAEKSMQVKIDQQMDETLGNANKQMEDLIKKYK